MFDKLEESSEPQFRGFADLLDQHKRGELLLDAVQHAAQSRIKEIVYSSGRSDAVVFPNEQDPSVIEKMIIGTKKPSRTMEKQFKWGVSTAEEKTLVMKSHEYAHVVSGLYEKQISDVLSGRTKRVSDWCEPYFDLYTKLSWFGNVSDPNSPVEYYADRDVPVHNAFSGLAMSENYREEEIKEYHPTKNPLRRTVLEDVAELVGAYMVSEAYFEFRMRNGNFRFPSDTQESMKDSIGRIVQYYVESQTEKQ